ncbi:MAG: LuxR C-terminal-related transcriptional regulator [Anaerolineaceae bacterium]|nr:LuxR C-terminal-related transcriptional regulator [Anaerolineaceae bacterium]
MPTSILATKLYIPPARPQLVPRLRLIERLNEGLSLGRQFTITSAPAGFGKTTLVSEWVTSCGRPVAWLSLDEGDNDPTQFLIYLVAALQTIAPNIGEGVLGVMQSPQPPSIESILTTLLNEITTIPDNFVLVLDDYHLTDSKAVDNALTFLLKHLPPQMHLVITTREDPQLPLARLRSRDQLTELRVADLRFTSSEAAEFIKQVMGLNLSTEDIAALEARTEGWIAGLQLAAISMQGHQDTTSFIKSFTGTHHFVLDYLVEEVLHQQPENIHKFLLHTSILDRLCGPLCDSVLLDPSTSGQNTLEYIEQANLFIVPLDNERRWYRYHHLFADLLRQRLGQSHTPEEIAQYHLRASEWFEQNGDIGEAFHHAIAVVDFERAARLLESSWLSMDETFQTGTWLGWVNQLPLIVRQVRPVLLTQMGWSYMNAGNAEASESSLKDAEACLKNPIEDLIIVEAEQFRALPVRIAIARAYNAQVLNRFADTVKFAVMAQDMALPDDEFLKAQASAILSCTYWASGELDKVYAFMSSWVDAVQQADNFAFAVAASFAKADILIAQGRLRDAIQVYQTAFKLATTHGVETITAHHHLGFGMLNHEIGEEERAAQHVQKSFDLGRHNTIVDWAYRKALAQALLKESEGDYDTALDLLDDAQRYYVRTLIPNLRPVDAMKSRIYLKQDRLDKAQAWAAKSGLSLLETPDYLHEFERLTLAKIALAEYQHDQNEQHILDVLKLLEGQLKLAQKQNRLRSQIEILVLQAFALQAKGESAQAISSLEKALSLAEPEGYLRIFVNEGEFLRLLILGVRSAIEKSPYFLFGYVEKLLAEFPQPTELQIQKSKFENPKPEQIDHLSNRELEVLRLIAQGLSNDEITQKLFVALSTIKGHNLRIFAKLQTRSRTEAVARARELGLL